MYVGSWKNKEQKKSPKTTGVCLSNNIYMRFVCVVALRSNIGIGSKFCINTCLWSVVKAKKVWI